MTGTVTVMLSNHKNEYPENVLIIIIIKVTKLHSIGIAP